MPKMYKLLDANGNSIHGGTQLWIPGQRTEKVEPRICQAGYHLVPSWGIAPWLKIGAVVWSAKGFGKTSSQDTRKIAFESAMVTERVGVLSMAVVVEFGRDCAKHVAKLNNSRSAYADAAALC